MSSLLAAIPAALSLRAPSLRATRLNSTSLVLLTTAVRFFLVLAFASSVALAGLVSLVPFLLWVALSHLALLCVDTAWALRNFGVLAAEGPA
jgi:hypothetical protein